MQLMKDDAFERTMESWAEQEQAAAPRMRPSDEMYRLVEGKQDRSGLFSAGLRRWTRVGATIVSVLLVALAYTQLYQPSIVVTPPGGAPVAVLRVSEAFPPQEGLVINRPPPGRYGGPKGQPVFFNQLDFQYVSPGATAVTALDLRQPTSELMVLQATASYRLALQLPSDSYVYVYQQSASAGVEQLFPNPELSDATNPLRQGETYYLPSPLDGFRIAPDSGEQTLHVVAATEALPELVRAYGGYAKVRDEAARQQALAVLLETLDGIEAAQPDQAVRWEFEFAVR